jgi:thioredoxin reductase
MTHYDLLIVGAGPAGYTASVYASRYQINHAIVGELPGGLVGEAHKICNWPGEKEISGFDLFMKMQSHVADYDVKMFNTKANEIKKEADKFILSLANGEQVSARVVLLATGTKHRHLGLEAEDRLKGRGLSYCATCDAGFYKNKITAVAGGGNSAMTAALYLGEVADKVYIFVRGTELNGEVAWMKAIETNPKIEKIFGVAVTDILGEEFVTGVQLSNGQEIKLDGLFVEIGSSPDNILGEQLTLEKDEYGYLSVNKDQSTNVTGVYAAGDLTNASNNMRQIVTAAAEGAIAAESIFRFLKK